MYETVTARGDTQLIRIPLLVEEQLCHCGAVECNSVSVRSWVALL